MIILIKFYTEDQKNAIVQKLNEYKHILNFKEIPFKNILASISGDCTISEFSEFNEGFQELAAQLDCSVQWGQI